ncbi:MAG: hypothetical protein ACYTXY_06285 [Nostoc sp.]
MLSKTKIVFSTSNDDTEAYSTQKVMILSSDSSSLMLFFPAIGGAIGGGC